MSGIGHLAAGFAVKPSTPEIPLWLLLAAGETNDLLYFVFSSIGLESKAVFTMDFVRGVNYVTQPVNAWSHGLFMSAIWSLAAAFLARRYYRNRRAAAMIGLVVFSHWILDFLMHSNLPIFFAGTPSIGLGLENSGAGFMIMTAIDLILLGSAILVYVRSRLRKSVSMIESRQ